MSQFVFKMPDLGEGTVDAEIVAWHTKPGDAVAEDQLIVEVMTDKAAVEVPAGKFADLDEIREIVFMMTQYCGHPRAREADITISALFAELDAKKK